MLTTLAKKIFGSRNERTIRRLQPIINKINAIEPEYEKLSDDALKALTKAFRKRLEGGELLDHLLPEAFAAAREASKRTLSLRPYDVQLVGGIVLHRNTIAEMKTGEGKTLMAVLAVYLNALTGKGVHVVTVNDYLAKRDAEWMAPIFEALDMTCASIIHGLTPEERRTAYGADVTYATNNELGFDYLRDNMAFAPEQLVQREPNFAIVDEVDSILIDEARTPLIISGPTEDKSELYTSMNVLIPKLKKETHYTLDEKQRTVALTDEGIDAAEKLLHTNGIISEDSGHLYDVQNVMLVHHLNQALRAHALFTKDVDYIVKDNQIILIDEFTGRMMPGRRLSEGLHQAIEAKEKVAIQNENQTLASITFQNYFRLYKKLGGMTGTADTEAEEFQTIYGLDVVVIPTHRPVARVDEADIIYGSIEAKYKAILEDIRRCNKKNQPVLVGTTSIEKSELLSAELKKSKIKHNVLNARYHEQEAEIIAQAGRKGAVTIATNMAGRGVDIKLGGNLDMLTEEKSEAETKKITAAYREEKQQVLQAGGLRIIGTERHESRRIDNQLRGRSGRQGDPGSSIFYLSLQDDLMRVFAPGMEKMMQRMDMPDDEAIQSRLVSGALQTAQRKLEARNFDIRKSILKYDDVLNEQRKIIYEQRREIMTSDTVDDVILEFRADALADAMHQHFPPGTYLEQWTVEEFKQDILRLFNAHPPVDTWLEEDGVATEDIHEQLQTHLDNIWKEKEERLGADLMRRLEKAMLLQILDHQWKNHLQRLDFLKQGTQFRGYAQKDPLNEYKKEAFAIFAELLTDIRNETVTILSRAEVNPEQAERLTNPAAPQTGKTAQPENFSKDTPRNAPCPCGSGKKFKHCHGKAGAELATNMEEARAS